MGVVKNDEQAQHWFAQSADKGNFFAQRRLGLIYLRNQGGALAAKWLAKTPLDHIDAYTLPYFAAAEGGASKAQYETGQFYEPLAKLPGASCCAAAFTLWGRFVVAIEVSVPERLG